MSAAKKRAPGSKDLSSAVAGLPVLVEPHHDIPLAELLLVLPAGASHDPAGREGALAVGARSLRRGAGERRGHELDEAFDRLGAELSVSVDRLHTSVHLTALRRNLEPALALFSDVILRPRLEDAEVERVVREQRASIVDGFADDKGLAGRYLRRFLFAGHPYGMPGSGTLRSLGELDTATVRAAWKSACTRRGAVLGACGDVTLEELAPLVERYLGVLPDTPAPVASLPEAEPVKGRHLVLVDKPERSQTQLLVGTLGSHATDKDHVPLAVGNTVFGGTFTSRLMREVRSKRGWSYGASSRLGNGRVRDAWWMGTFPAAQDAAACLALELGLLEKWVREGVSEREASFARSFLVQGHPFEVETAGRRLGRRVDVALGDVPEDYYDRWLERVEGSTQSKINKALKARIHPEDLVVAVVATADTLRASLEKSLPGLRSTVVVPFDSDRIPEAGWWR